MKARYTSRAIKDVDTAVDWYEQQRKGLGFEFLDCVEAAINGVLRHPELYPRQYVNFRRCVIRRFPFSIFYTIEGNLLVIHSVFDNRQDPEKLP